MEGDCMTLEDIQGVIDYIGKEAQKPRVRVISTALGPNIFKDHDISQWRFNQSLKARINESLKRIYIKKELRALKSIYKEGV